MLEQLRSPVTLPGSSLRSASHAFGGFREDGEPLHGVRSCRALFDASLEAEYRSSSRSNKAIRRRRCLVWC